MAQASQVQVVALDVAADVWQSRAQWLSADERARAARFQLGRNRDRFISCRGALREAIGARIGARPSAISFRYGPHGKPELTGPLAGTLSFNVSHSDGMALFAFTAEGPLGVDVERVRELPDFDPILSRFFSPGERALVHAVGPASSARRFLWLWTRKEARLKGEGRGVAGPHDGAGAETEALDWRLCSFSPAPGFIAALATRADAPFELKAWSG